MQRLAPAVAVFELFPAAARAWLVAAGAHDGAELKAAERRVDYRIIIVPGESSLNCLEQLACDMPNRSGHDAVCKWSLTVLRKAERVLAGQGSVLLIKRSVNVRTTILVRHGEDEVGSTELVPALVMENGAAPPVLEADERMQPVGCRVVDGGLVSRFARIETHLHNAQSERDDVSARRRVGRTAVNPAEQMLHAEMRQQAGRAPRVVDKRPDWNREPLSFVFSAGVVAGDRGAQEVELLVQMRFEVLHRGPLCCAYAAT